MAEPVRAEAASLAASSIRNIGPDWSRMRVGLTVDTVYVAPRQRGNKKGSRKRRNLAPLLLERAMEPALDHHTGEIERAFGQMLDRVADNFSR